MVFVECLSVPMKTITLRLIPFVIVSFVACAKPPDQVNPLKLPKAYSGMVTFQTTKDDGDVGKRTEEGSISGKLIQHADNPMIFDADVPVKLDVKFNLAGLACDPVAVDVMTHFELLIEVQSGLGTQITATGTYFAETRCCEGTYCSQQDVSTNYKVLTGCDENILQPFQAPADPDAAPQISGQSQFQCTAAQGASASRVTWNLTPLPN
jgi:hypothetical protein